MPIAALVAIPRDDRELANWAFANQAHHRDIIRRTFETRQIKLAEFPISPFDPKDPDSLAAFLQSHYQMHVAMDQALGIAINNLNVVDWEDPEALGEWMFAHYTEHQAAATILGIG